MNNVNAPSQIEVTEQELEDGMAKMLATMMQQIVQLQIIIQKQNQLIGILQNKSTS